MKEQLTVFIGRFSPFHLGHEEVLLRALREAEHVLVLIGSANQARTTKDPFTYSERRDIINNWYKSHKDKAERYAWYNLGTLRVLPLEDHQYNDQTWITSVQTKVLNTRELFDIPSTWPNVLTGAQRDTSTRYLSTFGSFFEQDFISESKVGFDYSATQLRDNYFSGGNAWEYKTPEETILFLDKFRNTVEYASLLQEFSFIKKYKDSWKAAPYAPTFVTVDTCVVQSGHVLVVTRAAQPGKGLYALPGGFLEQNERLQDAAIRELIEETSIGLSKAQLYGSILDKEIFDHPDRSLRGRTVTTCYLLKLKDTVGLPKIKAQPGEVSSLRWMPIAEALVDRSKWFEDHYSMLTTMLGRIKN